MKKVVGLMVLVVLLVGLVSATWWNPMSWGRGQQMQGQFPAYHQGVVNSSWPMIAIGNMGYGHGMMGGIYDTSFVDNYPKEDLTDEEVEDLKTAISEEYLARAMYAQSIEQFGESMPFSQIHWAEETHIDVLKKLFEKYDLEIPGDMWDGTFNDSANFDDACSRAVAAEVENIQRYTSMFESVDNADITEVFSLLQWGSSMHLRAFQMCSYGMGNSMMSGYGTENANNQSYRGLGYGMGRGMGPGMMFGY
jgi:hypothetical protein